MHNCKRQSNLRLMGTQRLDNCHSLYHYLQDKLQTIELLAHELILVRMLLLLFHLLSTTPSMVVAWFVKQPSNNIVYQPKSMFRFSIFACFRVLSLWSTYSVVVTSSKKVVDFISVLRSRRLEEISSSSPLILICIILEAPNEERLKNDLDKLYNRRNMKYVQQFQRSIFKKNLVVSTDTEDNMWFASWY